MKIINSVEYQVWSYDDEYLILEAETAMQYQAIKAAKDTALGAATGLDQSLVYHKRTQTIVRGYKAGRFKEPETYLPGNLVEIVELIKESRL